MSRVAQMIHGFNAGEFSPEMAARTDHEKYPFALHLCENFIPIVEGPGRRRPGFRFVNYTRGNVRAWLRKFDYSATQTYYIEFSNLKIRFFTNQGALLESAKTVTAATSANPIVMSSTAHGFSNGDTVFIRGMEQMRPLNGRFFKVANVAANTFELTTQDGDNVDGTVYAADSPGAGSAARVYEIASPYFDDLVVFPDESMTDENGACRLNTYQSGDVLYIAHPKFAPRQLTRVSDTNWTLTEYAPTNGPFNEINTSTTAMWANGTTGGVIIAASAATFASTDVGRLVRLNVTSRQASPWITGTAVSVGDYRTNGENTYKALTAANTGENAPTHTSGIVSDGAVLWEYQHSGYGIAKITAFGNAFAVTATVQAAQIGDVAMMPNDVVGAAFAITGITQANPAVVTAVGHTFSNGDVVAIDGVVGMTQVNGRYFVVTGVAGNNFSLLGVNSTSYTAYSSAGTAIKGATFNWQLGSWSATTEYPFDVSSFKQRIVWWGKGKPTRGWLTVSNEFIDMAQDEYGIVTSASAMSFIAPEITGSQWILGGTRLLIGAANGEFTLEPQNDTDPFGPINSVIVNQGSRKCRSVHAVTTGELALFLQKGGRKVFAAAYNVDTEKVKSIDTTAFARHAQKPSLFDLQYQSEPDPLVWGARTDGQLVGMTFEPDQNVNAWHRHPLGIGEVQSIQVGQSPDGQREEVWCVAYAEVDGVDRYFVGFMEKQWEDGDDIKDAFYVEFGLTYSALSPVGLSVPVGATAGASVTFGHTSSQKYFIAADVGKKIIVFHEGVRSSAIITAFTDYDNVVATVLEDFPSGILSFSEWYLSSKIIDGLDHLEGFTVQTLRDGGEEPDHVVTGGQITLSDWPLKAQIGLQCTARIVPMRLDQGSQDGTAQGKLKRVHEITLRMVDTVGGSVGPLGGTLDRVPFRTTGMAMDTAIPPFTGDKRVPFPGNSGRDDNQLTPNTRPEYRADKPFPVTLIGMIPYYVTQ